MLKEEKCYLVLNNNIEVDLNNEIKLKENIGKTKIINNFWRKG